MFERASSTNQTSYIPAEARIFEPPKERGEPDREVTPAAEGKPGNTDHRHRREDHVELSPRGRAATHQEGAGDRRAHVGHAHGSDGRASDRAPSGTGAAPGEHADARRSEFETQPERSTGRPGELTPEEKAEVRELQARDREVRLHEQAHAGVGGSHAGAPQYEYERGPDGRSYAVGGEVAIQLREGRTPEETARIAQQVRRAALAPANPSSQDRKVANEAARMEREARAEAVEERTDAEQTRRAEAAGSPSSQARGTSPDAPKGDAEPLPGGPGDDARRAELSGLRRAQEEASAGATDAYLRIIERRADGVSEERSPGSLSLLA